MTAPNHVAALGVAHSPHLLTSRLHGARLHKSLLPPSRRQHTTGRLTSRPWQSLASPSSHAPSTSHKQALIVRKLLTASHKTMPMQQNGSWDSKIGCLVDKGIEMCSTARFNGNV